MKVVIVGAGGTSRELLRRLGELWDVTVIDTDESALATARPIREFDELVGDGSSALVLRRAGIGDADALIAATNDDDVNLESARIAQSEGLLRVAAVVAVPERLAEYRELGIAIVTPDTIAARQLEVELEPRRITSTEFAQGKAEAIEFQIAPDSTVRDKALRELHSETWIVAGLLREGELIIPHGETRLRSGDRVTVVGRASDFATIVKTFTSGESRFPLNFGRKVAVVLDSAEDLDGPVSEATSLVRNSQANGLIVVHADPERDGSRLELITDLLGKLEARSDGVDVDRQPTMGDLGAALRALTDQESIGVVVVPAPEGGELTGRMRTARVLNDYAGIGVPVLLSRATHPYASVLVPARTTPAGEAAGRAGIDIARTSGAALTGLAVIPPRFVGDDGDVDEAKQAAAWLRQEAAVQGVQPKRRVRRGNPVRLIEEAAASASLLVLSTPEIPVSAWRPGITGHVVRRTAASVLLVPPPR